eukprot:237343-Amphidinium_carterae.2
MKVLCDCQSKSRQQHSKQAARNKQPTNCLLLASKRLSVWCQLRVPGGAASETTQKQRLAPDPNNWPLTQDAASG